MQRRGSSESMQTLLLWNGSEVSTMLWIYIRVNSNACIIAGIEGILQDITSELKPLAKLDG